MSVVSRFDRTLKEMKASINKSIQTSIAKNESVLVDQQTKKQWYEGKDAFNVSIVPKYAESTRLIKKNLGQVYRRVTLNDTGDLYNDINIKANLTQAVISTKIEYFDNLVFHYRRNQLLGIQEPAMRKFLIKYTLPEIEKNFKAIIKK